MAVLCLLTNTPWPWPTPAGAASARGGFPTRNEVEGGSRPVCTSAARKIRVPLVARQGRSPSGRLGYLASRGAQEDAIGFVLGVGVAGGKCPLRRVPEDGGFLAGCRLGGVFPLSVWPRSSVCRVFYSALDTCPS